MSEFRYVVGQDEESLPLKTIIKQQFSFSSRLITKLRQQELIRVNGYPTPGWVSLKAGDVVTVSLPEESSDYPPEAIPIEVCYEDEDILVLNKQPGYVVHPTKGKPYHTIANGLMLKMLLEAGAKIRQEDLEKKALDEGSITKKLKADTKEGAADYGYSDETVSLDKSNLDESRLYKIRFVNRLDMNTSGLLIVAKNSHAQDHLEKQMQSDTIEKRYKALVEGIISEDGGTIDKPIGRPDPEEVERWILPLDKGGFDSVTHFKVLERFEAPHRICPKGCNDTSKQDEPYHSEKNDAEKGEILKKDGYTLVELRLETGRTHQIRVHMASIGHPVVGDHLYCHGDPFEYRRIYGDPRPPKDGTKGPRETNPEVVSELIDRQALHAFSLDFDHPMTKERLHIEAELPKDMKAAIADLICD